MTRRKVATTSSRRTKIGAGISYLSKHLSYVKPSHLTFPIKSTFCELSHCYKIGTVRLQPDFVTENVYLTLGFIVKHCSKLVSFV
jgi:hypothetical protein